MSNNNVFVKTFPAFDRIQKGPANGLVHAFNQITAPDPGAIGSTILASEITAVSYTTSTFARQTAPIAVFGVGRGVSIKEIAAVQAGGAPYDPQKTEMANGMIKLAVDVQGTMMQGNASNAGGTAAQEAGLYNAAAFDGFRGVLGSVSAFSANSSIQQDIGTLNMLESLQTVAAKAANNGGTPDLVFLSVTAKQALDIEQQTLQRYQTTEIVPGVRATQVGWANGLLDVLPVPGSSIGSYNRTSDSALVEDAYVIDTSVVTLRWLYSESFTVLQIPSGVDGILSNRFIIFGLFGMEIAAPLFCGKCRRLAS